MRDRRHSAGLRGCRGACVRYGTVSVAEHVLPLSCAPRDEAHKSRKRRKSRDEKLSTPITMLHTDTPQTHSTEFIVSV